MGLTISRVKWQQNVLPAPYRCFGPYIDYTYIFGARTLPFWSRLKAIEVSLLLNVTDLESEVRLMYMVY